MKKTITTVSIAIIILLSSSAFVKHYHSTGMAGYTASPNEGSCNTCHSGGSSTAAGTTITSIPSFSLNEFVPGTTYTITVQLAAVGFNRYGFGCEILNGSNANTGNMQLITGEGVKFLLAGQRQNAVHTAAKVGTGGSSFSFEWVSPTVDTVATIYVAGNAVNFNSQASGDFPISPVNMKLTAYKAPLEPTTAIHENKLNVISGISVYPNPARGLTSISYFLSKTENVSVQLLDMNGRVIKDLLSEKQASGSHSHFLDLQNVASGVYFVKTSIADQKVSQKLIAIQ